MRVIALDRMNAGNEGASHIFERLLRDRDSVWRQIAYEQRLDLLLREMVMYIVGASAAYGAVLGLSHGLLQALASAIKLPTLFLLTLAICLPALYLSNLLLGGRLSARQVCALLLSAITISSVFMLAVVPISVFFLLTAHSYTFFVLLNVVILTITSMVGLGLLIEGVRFVNRLAVGESAAQTPTVASEADGEEQPAPIARRKQPKPADLGLLYFWLLLYAFVGTQLGWTLRPFFGVPSTSFQLFRAAEGNFYESVLTMLGGLLF